MTKCDTLSRGLAPWVCWLDWRCNAQDNLAHENKPRISGEKANQAIGREIRTSIAFPEQLIRRLLLMKVHRLWLTEPLDPKL